MSKVNLKDNIWIEGFGSMLSLIGGSCFYNDNDINFNIIYSGKTSEIPEDVAEELLSEREFLWDKSKCQCGERDTCYYCQNIFNSEPLELIEDLIKEEYCIIYKQS